MRALASGPARPGAVAAAPQPGGRSHARIVQSRIGGATQRAAASRVGRCSSRRGWQPPSRRPWSIPASTGGSNAPPGDGDGRGSGSGGGNDGGGGGNDGGSGGDGSGGDAPNLGSNIWMLAVAAAAALGLFSVGSKRLQLRRQLVQAGLGRQAGDAGGDTRWAGLLRCPCSTACLCCHT